MGRALDSLFAQPPRPRRRRTWFVVLLLYVGSGLLLSLSFYHVCRQDVRRYFSPSRAHARAWEQYRQKHRAMVDSMVETASNYIRQRGGFVHGNEIKRSTYYEVDLRVWRGTDQELVVLGAFRLLADNNRLNDRLHDRESYISSLCLPSRTTDDSLALVTDLTNLRELNLASTSITDAGLAHLDRLVALHSLNLSGTRISGTGLVHLERLRQLSSLDLSRTAITDAGVKPLSRLKHLRWLDLRGTQISDAAATQWQRQMPHVTILHRLEKLEKAER